MGGRLPGGFSIRGLSGGERRRLNIAAGASGMSHRLGGPVWNPSGKHGWIRIILWMMFGRSHG